MNRVKIIQTGKELVIEENNIPAQYSADIAIEFVKDELFADYIVVPSIKYGNTTNALTIEDGIVMLPKQAFTQGGYIRLAFLLDNGAEQFNTNQVELHIDESVGGSDVLPHDEKVWTAVVINAVDNYMDIKYIKILDDLIASNKKLNTDTIALQKAVNEVVAVLNEKLDNNDFIPKHKIENGKLHFSNPDGTWDNGYALVGQSTVLLDEVVQEQIKYTTGPTGVTEKQLCRTVINGKEVLTPVENVFFVGGRFDGKSAKEVVDNVVIFVSDNDDGTITIDCPD